MTLVFGHDESVAQWTGQKMGVVFHPPYAAFGVIDDEGTLIGGLVYNEWNGANITITVYLPQTLKRGVIRAAFRYAFNQVGASRLTAKVRRDNRPMKKILPRLGFKYEATLKGYYGKDDALIFRLLPDEAAKWM